MIVTKPKFSLVACDRCNRYHKSLTAIFTSNIGFKDLCDWCVKINESDDNKQLNTFPTKIEFDKRRVI